MHTTSLPLVSTPTYQKMRELCDVALDTPNGIRIPFTIGNYGGDLEGAKKAGRRFQQLFSSFRARARNTVQARLKQRNDEFGEQNQSPYDKLAAFKIEREDGVDICIMPSASFEIAHEILDAKTGEPIALVTPENRRIKRYIELIFTQIERENKDGSRSPTPLSIEQELDAFALDERTFGELYTAYRWRMKSTGLPYGEKAQAKPDLLDTSMDDFGVSEDGA